MKIKNYVGSWLMSAALVTSLFGGMPNQATAQSQGGQNRSEAVYQAFEDIMNIRERSVYRIGRCGEAYLYRLADRIGNNNGYASPQEIKHALNKLGKITDRYFGNNDGRLEPDEIDRIDNPGLRSIFKKYHIKY